MNTKRLILAIVMLTTTRTAFASGYLDTPDVCYAIKKVQEDNIYLHKVSRCTGEKGKVFIESDRTEFNVFTEGTHIGRHPLRRLNTGDVSSVLKEADRMSGEIKLPENKHLLPMNEKAQQTYNYYASREFQDRLKQETEKIKKSMFNKEHTTDNYYSDAKNSEDKLKKLKDDERIYVLISSSMPTETIRAYVSSIERLEDKKIVIAMRGFVDGMKKIGPTLRFMAEVLKKDATCTEANCAMKSVPVMVDPLVFRLYGVTRVPAVVYVRGLDVVDQSASEAKADNIKSAGQSFVAYGDASLSYLLTKIQQESDSETLKSMISRL